MCLLKIEIKKYTHTPCQGPTGTLTGITATLNAHSRATGTNTTGGQHSTIGSIRCFCSAHMHLSLHPRDTTKVKLADIKKFHLRLLITTTPQGRRLSMTPRFCARHPTQPAKQHLTSSHTPYKWDCKNRGVIESRLLWGVLVIGNLEDVKGFLCLLTLLSWCPVGANWDACGLSKSTWCYR